MLDSFTSLNPILGGTNGFIQEAVGMETIRTSKPAQDGVPMMLKFSHITKETARTAGSRGNTGHPVALSAPNQARREAGACADSCRSPTGRFFRNSSKAPWFSRIFRMRPPRCFTKEERQTTPSILGGSLKSSSGVWGFWKEKKGIKDVLPHVKV